MSEQEKTVKSQKRRGPAPTGKGKPVLVRLQPDLLKALDAASEHHAITRPEALRMILKDWFEKQTYLPDPDE